jgi:hypothetical protein
VKINAEEKKKKKEMNCKDKKRERKKEFVQDDQARTCTYVVAIRTKKKRKFSELERQTIKKRTLHKWTPDSARLLDAYLSVGYGSNIGGVLQCAR